MIEFIDAAVKAVLVLSIIAAIAGFMVYLERKILGYAQRRLGPIHVGPFGLLQLLADGIKLFCKEDIIPCHANRFLFMIAPIISTCAAFISVAAVPFLPEFYIGDYLVRPLVADINIGILFVLGVGAIGVYGPLLAGLSSGGKYSLIGAARATMQLLSFEVVSGLSLLAPIMLVGSLSLVDINNYQSDGFFSWLFFQQPVAFFLFLIAGYAELNRTPFDLLEHEAEIVAGYATEYSGIRWGLFFVAEYANMITLSFLVSLLFFGGFNAWGFIPGGIAILIKVAFFISLFMWVRATYPHVRSDQLMWVCWKIFMPLAILNTFITAIVLVF
mgnify:CR=1 FL=1